MALDLEAIRRRVNELNGMKKNSDIQKWKPGVGNYKVRGLPWRDNVDGMPLKEAYFYYLGKNYPILAPNQFGKPDPINDLIRKLYSSGSPDDRAIAKKLHSKMRAYMAVIVRGEEDKGVQVWEFGKPIYTRLLSFYTEEDVGDILDPLEGFELKVQVIHPPGKMFNGKPSLETTIDVARKSSKLSEDPVQMKQWLDSVPNLDDMHKLKSPQEIETILQNWLNGDMEDDKGSNNEKNDEGEQRSSGDKKLDELDTLAKEVKSSAPAAKKQEKKEVAPKRRSGSDDLDALEESAPPKKSLDDVFKELEEEDS